eukprot:4534736-Alexandrium_andersonii.AAC.1
MNLAKRCMYSRRDASVEVTKLKIRSKSFSLHRLPISGTTASFTACHCDCPAMVRTPLRHD